MGIVIAYASPGSTKDTGRRWEKDGYTYGLLQWVQSGKYDLFCTSLDMVINKRERTGGGSKIRNAWTAVRNDEIASELLKEGIKVN